MQVQPVGREATESSSWSLSNSIQAASSWLGRSVSYIFSYVPDSVYTNIQSLFQGQVAHEQGAEGTAAALAGTRDNTRFVPKPQALPLSVRFTEEEKALPPDNEILHVNPQYRPIS